MAGTGSPKVRCRSDESETGMAGHETSRQAADALALALEDVGFDVGRVFPLLRATADRDGAPVVEIGPMTPVAATQLAQVLTMAAESGVTVERLQD